ncbi:MAG TPA: hypothetical protein VKZ95_02330 [Sphingobacteriaceae bacterium]|nr:hypothetical protein [Sphingobacteriaceae bacterium]
MDKAKKGRALSRPGIKKRYRNSDILADEYNNRAIGRVIDMYSPFYAGIDPRRRQEMADGGMVKEDPAAMANLSSEFIHAQYPRVPYYSNPFIATLEEE